jgi:carbamoyl-phosphate synthase large subunit
MAQPRAEAEARAVAAALGASGPCNVQLRVTERGPVTFEINPRFSGGVSIRAHFGFNEVEMAIRDLVLDEPVPQLKLSSGLALRFWEEMYVKDAPASGFTAPKKVEALAAAL